MMLAVAVAFSVLLLGCETDEPYGRVRSAESVNAERRLKEAERNLLMISTAQGRFLTRNEITRIDSALDQRRQPPAAAPSPQLEPIAERRPDLGSQNWEATRQRLVAEVLGQSQARREEKEDHSDLGGRDYVIPPAVDPYIHSIPKALPVPDEPGMVMSPYSSNAGYIDVRGLAPGTQIRDPYSRKMLLVP